MDNEQLMAWIETTNANSIRKDGCTTRYNLLSFEADMGYFSMGIDITDTSGNWLDWVSTYYFRNAENFLEIIKKLRSKGKIGIARKGFHYYQHSMHDPYYRDDDYREECVQMGEIKAKLSIIEEKLVIDDVIFEPAGEKLAWKENNVNNMHTKEIKDFVKSH